MAQNTGGLGGLGGFFQRPAVQDTMDAIFTSMISSPRNNVLQNFAPAYNAAQDRRALMGEQAAMQEALVAAGLSPEQAKVMAVNPQAAKLRLDMMERQRDMEMQAQQRGQTYDFFAQNAPEYAAMIDAGLPVQTAWSEYVKSRGGGERQGLINAGDGMIYDPNSKEWITAPGSENAGGPFRFGGNSVEAQALNGLMDSGQLTVDQAQQLAAGKTITGPNGEIIFMTPQGVFSRPSADGGSQPDAGGNIQVTGPKAPDVNERAAGGFADRLNNSGALIDELENAGTNRTEQFKSMVPVFGNDLVSEDYQKLDQAKRDFVNAVLRRESGAVISPEEFENANKQYFPQPGDTPATIKQKARNRALVIESMTRDAGPTYKRSGANAAGKTSGGVQWSIEP